MVDPTSTTGPEATGANGAQGAKTHFTKAMEEAMAGAHALAGECKDKFSQTKDELGGEAKTRSDDARDKASAFAEDAKVRASEYAVEGKARTSAAIVSLSKVIDDNTATIDDKVGVKYGDYARTASQSMKDAATKLDEKSFEELGEDAKTFVRESPGLAVGMAVAAGYVLGKLFTRAK